MSDGVTSSATGCGHRDPAVADESSGTNTDNVVLTADLLGLVCRSQRATALEPEHSEFKHEKVGPCDVSLACSCISVDARPRAVKVAVELICKRLFRSGLFKFDLG